MVAMGVELNEMIEEFNWVGFLDGALGGRRVVV
jgi:hypothetical protein